MLLRTEKSNRLSSNFRLSPFKIVRKTGSEVTVNNGTGVEFRGNAAFVKKYHVQEGLSTDADNGGSEGASAAVGKAQDEGSSDAEENKEDERVDVGNKESEIHHQWENIHWSTGQVVRSELVAWLTANRSTPQATTGSIPFSLMFGREVRSKLPDLRRETANPFKEEVREREREWSN